ncbi:hypothetical protein CPB84DRAFT_1787047 [Gymnopilus junonius]|uniref:Secreted protein n=1 Tax=Gymnopilus junonius TaxID=109634 RepID=A0A9P5NJF0_GYMJU|nr:hypothetical protein CPB84DRAFT_1787047 [Gymnopilus junonius]
MLPLPLLWLLSSSFALIEARTALTIDDITSVNTSSPPPWFLQLQLQATAPLSPPPPTHLLSTAEHLPPGLSDHVHPAPSVHRAVPGCRSCLSAFYWV